MLFIDWYEEYGESSSKTRKVADTEIDSSSNGG